MYISSLYISNFQVLHYAINLGNEYLCDNGKVTIKGIFKGEEKKEEGELDILDIGNYHKDSRYKNFKIDNTESKDNNKKSLKVIQDAESDLLFDLKKISLDKGNEFIYLKNIISQLEFFLDNISNNNNNSKKIISIKQNLKFFSNYLMNIDKSFYDPNFNTNIPIQSRQNNLLNYRILEIMDKIIKFFNSSSSVQRADKSKENRSMQDITDLFKEILIFLLFLSENNNKIKKKIFSENMQEILKLGENIFDNKSILLFFIFKITKKCPEIQEVIIGEDDINTKKSKQPQINIYDYGKENSQLNNNIAHDEKDSQEEINVSINFASLANSIMECTNFYHFFDKILKFKVTFPKINLKSTIEYYFFQKKQKPDEKIEEQCKALADLIKSNDGSLTKTYDLDQLKTILNVIPKLEFKKFLFMKESLISYLKDDIITNIDSALITRKTNFEKSNFDDLSHALKEEDIEEDNEEIKIDEKPNSISSLSSVKDMEANDIPTKDEKRTKVFKSMKLQTIYSVDSVDSNLKKTNSSQIVLNLGNHLKLAYPDSSELKNINTNNVGKRRSYMKSNSSIDETNNSKYNS